VKKGVVYQSEGEGSKEIYVGRILKIARPVGIWAKRVGWSFLCLSIIIFIWIFSPLLIAETKYGYKDLSRQSYDETSVKVEIVRTIYQVPSEIEDSKFNGYTIFIPKIDAESKVISDVDPFDKNAYTAALQKGVAEAAGLSHPGQRGTTYLFAHSVGNRIDFARYNAIFYLLNKLTIGDKIFINYRGDEYDYEVTKKEILLATDLRYLQPQLDEEVLILQTCYPPGTSWKRLMVIGKRAGLDR